MKIAKKARIRQTILSQFRLSSRSETAIFFSAAAIVALMMLPPLHIHYHAAVLLIFFLIGVRETGRVRLSAAFISCIFWLSGLSAGW